MYVSRIRLIGFRNYESIQLTLPPGISVFIGNNGQGKTNLLEAVYLCCTGRSHRTSKEREMVRFSDETAYVELEVQKNDGSHLLQVSFSRDKTKKIRINGTPITRIGELMGHLGGVIFSPEDLKIVKEGPLERRRYIDIMLSQTRPAYFFALQSYQKALYQRNQILKLAAMGQNSEALPEFTEQLAVRGLLILKWRYELLEKLKPIVRENHFFLSDGNEKLSLKYMSQFSDESLVSHEPILALLNARLADDIRRGVTSVGPHRDDLQLTLDGKDIRAFGSQGQQRTAALSLKLSELDIMCELMGESPVLMLDDVMSELDPVRKRLLLEKLHDIQTLIACTSKSDVSETINADYFNITKGNAKRFIE